MEAGANLDMADNRGRTALLDACSRGHVDVARLLLEAGASKDPPQGGQRDPKVEAM